MSTDNDINKKFSIYSGNIFIYTVFITARICIDEKCVLVTLSIIALQGKLIITTTTTKIQTIAKKLAKF